MVRGGSSGSKKGVGRTLVKQHNQAAQLAKEKGRALGKQRVPESVTDVGDIDAVIEQAEEAGRIFDADKPLPDVLINLDLNSNLTPEERRERQKREEIFHQISLRVPRRPPWNISMSPEELDDNERNAFLSWRRALARLEENDKLVLTPFEKSLDIWRQLWRVLERSDLLVMVVDARDPLFYRCPDLEEYAKEIDEHKKTMLLVNKADLLPFRVRKSWARYFRLHGISYVFWSAKAASATLEGKNLNINWGTEEGELPSGLSHEDVKIYGRYELLVRLHREAKAIAEARGDFPGSGVGQLSHLQHHSAAGGVRRSDSKNVVVGFVGYPNVGKSSTINALVGEKRTGVTSTPGKTRHFQTLIISEELTLCDCPGLVFPSFSSSRYDMIASGVLPIDRMTEHRQAVQVVANHVPRIVLENVYNISIPKPKPYELQSRPPFSSELLRAYCSSRGYVTSSGLPDETRAARQILKDYIDGKLLHFKLPPAPPEDVSERDKADTMGLSDFGDYINKRGAQSAGVELEKQHEASEDGGSSNVAYLLSDLDAFDSSNGLVGSVSYAKEKKAVSALDKHHKKPQRKKDRSWRVGNDGGDGMPVVRVFQKPVSFAAMKAI